MTISFFSFAQLPVEICIVILTFLDFDSLLVIPRLEKYLKFLMAKITTWQYLHHQRLPHLATIPSSLPEIKHNLWLSYRYYLTITNVDKKNLVVMNNLDKIKG